MSRGRTPRRHEIRYFVLRSAEQAPEIARISPRGAPAFWHAASGTWINDPLLGAEIRVTDEWVRTAPEDLPDDVTTTRPPDGRTGRGRSSRRGLP